MDLPYRASLGALFYSLSADTLLIIARAYQGMSEKEIVDSSGKWSFTLNRVQSAYAETCKVFERTYRSPEEARTHAIAVYSECRELGLLRPPQTGEASIPLVSGSEVESITRNTDTREVAPMDASAHDVHFESTKRVALLTASQRVLLSLLTAGKSDNEVMRLQKLSQESFDATLVDILDFLHINRGETLSRRRQLACSAFKHSQLKQHGEELPIESPVDTQRRASAVQWERPSPTPATPSAVVKIEKGVEHEANGNVRRSSPRMFNGVNVNTPEFKATFAANLKMLVEARGMTHKAIFQDAELSPNFSFGLREGTARLDEEKIRHIAKALKIRPEFLLVEHVYSLREIADEFSRLRGELQTTSVAEPPAEKQSSGVEISTPEATPEPTSGGGGESAHFLDVLIKEPKKAMAFAHLIAALDAFNIEERKLLVSLLFVEQQQTAR